MVRGIFHESTERSGKMADTLEMSESKKLRERAINCHRLAVGAGDPQFALKLNALADEYEAKAVEADAKATSSKK
jgi:hypothetical protein